MEGDKAEQEAQREAQPEAQRDDGGKSRLYHAVVQAMADADWEMARVREKNAQKLKTNASAPRPPQDLGSAKRRRGAQPGNGNAVKTGHHSAEMKAERRMLRGLKRRARAAVATVNGALGGRKRGRPRLWD